VCVVVVVVIISVNVYIVLPPGTNYKNREVDKIGSEMNDTDKQRKTSYKNKNIGG